MKGREKLIRAYTTALDLVAVYVATDGERSRVGASSDPEKRVRESGGAIAATTWCLEQKFAERVVAGARSRLQELGAECVRGWWSIDASVTIRVVASEIENQGVAVQSSENIRANADEAITVLESMLADLRRGGELKSVNRSYREYRLKCSAEARAAMPYAGWIWNFKTGLVRDLAENSRIDFGKIKSDIKK